MTVYKCELKRGRNALIIWTSAIVLILLVCIGMFPEIAKQSEMVEQIYSQLGSMSAAFGMDRISMSDALGFYGVECGNMLGLGGAFFAAILGISALAGEEKNRTAEFLLTHPISRTSIVKEKLLFILTNLVILNVACFTFSYIGYLVIGEHIAVDTFALLHLGYFLTQLELASICFCVSSIIRSSNVGIGIGIATLAYMLNIIANLTSKAEFLKYITPFGYADAADIITQNALDVVMVVIGLVVSIVSVVFAFAYYNKKNINA